MHLNDHAWSRPKEKTKWVQDASMWVREDSFLREHGMLNNSIEDEKAPDVEALGGNAMQVDFGESMGTICRQAAESQVDRHEIATPIRSENPEMKTDDEFNESTQKLLDILLSCTQ